MLVLAVVVGSVGATPLAVPKPPPPSSIPPMPKGPTTRCTMTGPAWAAYGIHTPNSPPRRGNQYQVTAWGIPCSKAKGLLRALFHKIPPHRTGKLAGAPQGFTCKSVADGSTKNRLYSVNCLRLTPAATFGWQPIGGKVT
jgi:hypothetical protein